MIKPLPHKPADSLPQSSKSRGDVAESLALAYLQAQGLRLVRQNYKTLGRGGGEVDLIMWDARPSGTAPALKDGIGAGRGTEPTLVFIEVRTRHDHRHGGAAASITRTKRQRLVFAAQSFLQQFVNAPPCRFDVVAVDGLEGTMEWIEAAFDGQ